MAFLKRYQAYVKNHHLQHDPYQDQAVTVLNELYQGLLQRRWFAKPLKGVYLWGKVGRGKTFLMDLFYIALPLTRKIRLHFHHFMHTIHHELKHYQGKRDPLKKIANAFSKKYKVLCFDEFHVSDIADAMILAELFKNLFQRGVVIVATSNCEPEGLYPNGLQRDKFLPTIKLIRQNMDIVHLSGELDYRLQYLSQSQCYHYPLNEAVAEKLKQIFDQLTLKREGSGHSIRVNDRSLKIIAYADSVIWFTFRELCETPRSSEDYIEIARCFDTLILSDVPQMGVEKEAAAKRFMHLIDELYDRHVTLILSAAGPVEQLYNGRLLADVFARTQSRLKEMQTTEYLTKPHLA